MNLILLFSLVLRVLSLEEEEVNKDLGIIVRLIKKGCWVKSGGGGGGMQIIIGIRW